MLIDIISHTPRWVFAVFALLAWMGVTQMRASRAHLNRVISVPVIMIALAVYGVVNAFGHSPAGLFGLGVWAIAAALVLGVVLRLPLNPGVRYDAASREFSQPGSWVPMALMMGIFLTKYVVGVTLAYHPEYAHQTGFAMGVSTLYGVFSGVFAGRALRLWKLAFRGHASVAAA